LQTGLAEFVEDEEVEAHQMLGEAAGTPGPGFGLELVHQIDDVEEAAAVRTLPASP
jgi:hypothetical protein